jgi:hypothetical protein
LKNQFSVDLPQEMLEIYLKSLIKFLEGLVCNFKRLPELPAAGIASGRSITALINWTCRVNCLSQLKV